MSRMIRWRLVPVVIALVCVGLVASATLRQSYAAQAPDRSGRAMWETLIQEQKSRLASSPQDHDALFWTAIGYANIGRIKDSGATFQRLHQLDPNRYVIRRQLATNEPLAAREPDNLLAMNALAFIAYAEDKYELAAQRFGVIVGLDPDNPWATAYYGYSLGKAGRTDDAVRLLEHSVIQFPENQHLRFLLGMAYYRKGWLVKAVKEMARARMVLGDFQ